MISSSIALIVSSVPGSMPLVTLTIIAAAGMAWATVMIAARAKREGTAITTVAAALTAASQSSVSSSDAGSLMPGR